MKLFTEQPRYSKPKTNKNTQSFLQYKKVCREGDPIPSKLHKYLMCYNFDNSFHPRLVLQPIKLEIVHIKPTIYILHDFVSDKEIDRLKELANPNLKRATVRRRKPTREAAAIVNYRIGKSGWLRSKDDNKGYVKRIDQRISDVTSLDLTTSEPLQVLNYGIGGHYEAHYDFVSSDSKAPFDELIGNRISTLLIYVRLNNHSCMKVHENAPLS
jgi:prolyl 4-hydroxylase